MNVVYLYVFHTCIHVHITKYLLTVLPLGSQVEVCTQHIIKTLLLSTPDRDPLSHASEIKAQQKKWHNMMKKSLYNVLFSLFLKISCVKLNVNTASCFQLKLKMVHSLLLYYTYHLAGYVSRFIFSFICLTVIHLKKYKKCFQFSCVFRCCSGLTRFSIIFQPFFHASKRCLALTDLSYILLISSQKSYDKFAYCIWGFLLLCALKPYHK